MSDTPAGQTPAETTTEQQTGTGPAPGSVDALGPEAAKLIRELRQEAAANRKRAADAEAELKGIKDGQLSEAEKLQKAATEAQAARDTALADLKATRLQLSVESEARKLGIVDPTIAGRLIDGAAVTWDGNAPSNVATLLGDLVKDRPWLLAANHGTGQAPAAVGSPGGTQRRLTRDDVRKMTPDQINQNWDAVQAALKGT